MGIYDFEPHDCPKRNRMCGYDTFTGKDLSPTFEQVQKRLDDVKAKVLDTQENSQEDKITRTIRHLILSQRFPVFKQDDIVQSHNLPNNFDFAFCKLVLGNIFSGAYGNSTKGEDGVNQAIHNCEPPVHR